MELVIGTLLSTGHTLDDVLDMSWDHIRFASASIMTHKSYMLGIIFDAVSIGLGGKKAKKKGQEKYTGNKSKSKQSKEEKDAALLSGIRNMGLKI